MMSVSFLSTPGTSGPKAATSNPAKSGAAPISRPRARPWNSMVNKPRTIPVIIGRDTRPEYGPNRPWYAAMAHPSDVCRFHPTNRLPPEADPEYNGLIFNGLTALMTPASLDLIEWLAAAKHRHIIYLHDIDWCYQAYQRYHPREAQRLEALDKRHTFFLAVSNNQKQFIRRTFDVPEERIQVIGVSSPVTAAREEGAPPTPRPCRSFGTVATIQPRKGTDFFVEAAITACRQRPEAMFHWFGQPFLDPGYHVELARTIEAAGFSHRIMFHGHIQDTTACYRQLDVALLPSRDDPFALCVLEAMSFGKPCIGFKSGGYPEQVGDAGIIVEEMSADALARACLRAMDNPDLPALGQAARTRYEQHHHPRVFVPRLLRSVKQIFDIDGDTEQ
ncbi:MAG: glycosyltransferase [Spartobacteria bacterium]|nr:glycosyltransferase [Spartobacteria bacterium]